LISVSLGDYSGAINDAQQAIDLREGSAEDKDLATDYNTLGRANQYLGYYRAALGNYTFTSNFNWEETGASFLLEGLK